MISTLLAVISNVVVKPDSTSWWQATVGPLVGSVAGAGIAGFFLLRSASGDRKASAGERLEERLALRAAERDAYQRDVARALIGLVSELAQVQKRLETGAYGLRGANDEFDGNEEQRRPWLDGYHAAHAAVDVSIIPVVARSEELIDRELRQRVNVFVTTVQECLTLEHARTTARAGAKRPTDSEVAVVSARVATEFGVALRGVAELSCS